MVEVKGTISYVTFHNPENGYSVLKVTGTTYNGFTVVCKSMIEPQIGTTYLFRGEWKSDKYGKKLEAIEYEEVLPSDVYSIEKYLASGLVKGIGPAYAKKLVDTLGKDTLEVIESKSDRIFSVKGIGKKRVESIWKSWDEHRYLRSMVSFLKDYGISMNFIVKIYHCYGDGSIDIIKKSPYKLVRDIDGLGFGKVDALAIKMGHDRTGIDRCKAGIIYTLEEFANDGNVYAERSELVHETAVLLEISNNYIDDAIWTMINDDEVVQDGEDIYLQTLYRDEVNVADRLTSMLLYEAPSYTYDISKVEQEIGIEYDKTQKDGIDTALRHGVSVITGGPGTGKTTILLGVIKALQAQHKTIAAAAPTGKAAKRMQEVTGLDAKTIHRLLSYVPGQGYSFDKNNQLSYDVVIIDEISMVNIQLMSILMDAISFSTKLILVGDVDQLPAIGPGNVLYDIISSDTVPVVKLEKIYRQAEHSNIVVNAHRVNHGELPKIQNTAESDFFFMKEENNDSILRLIPDLVQNRLPKRYNIKPNDIQVLSPMRKNEIGSINLNNVLQKVLNPTGPEITHGFITYRMGDKVMQIKNNYEKGIFNGETGKVVEVNLDMKSIMVDFDGNLIHYERGELDELNLAYACTIHKSQGSEYPIVVIPIVRQHYNMMQRNLIYTAITRARNICVIVGDITMIQRAVSNNISRKRNTKLRERLNAAPKILK